MDLGVKSLHVWKERTQTGCREKGVEGEPEKTRYSNGFICVISDIPGKGAPSGGYVVGTGSKTKRKKESQKKGGEGIRRGRHSQG